MTPGDRVPTGRAGQSAWARVPEQAAVRGLAAVVAALPPAALLGALAGGARGALGAALGIALIALCQLLSWAATRMARSEPAAVLALLLVASYATKAGVILLGVLLLGDRLADARPALALSAGLAAVLAATVEAAVITRTRAPYVEL